MAGSPAGSDLLVCPSCGASRPAGERFCPTCRLPLVFDERELPVKLSEGQVRARKVKPQLAEGELVRVAWARNQAEAEFIQGLLLEEGVPSLLRRSAGFDVPDFLAAGPRDVLVPRSGEATAREVLLEADIIKPERAAATTTPVRLFAGVLVALFAAALIVWLAFELLR